MKMVSGGSKEFVTNSYIPTNAQYTATAPTTIYLFVTFIFYFIVFSLISDFISPWGFGVLGSKYVSVFCNVLRSVTYCSPKPQNPFIAFKNFTYRKSIQIGREPLLAFIISLNTSSALLTDLPRFKI